MGTLSLSRFRRFMTSLPTASLLPDPHNVSNTLDDETSKRIITRLESRGRDTVFRSLFEAYFPKLLPCKRVLEIGCGTGVVLRALMQQAEFSGQVTGLDQSTAFLEAATRFAQKDGCDMTRMSFIEADAHRVDKVEGRFDAVLMHTLLSHVSNPVEVLLHAHQLAAPGALLIVMDGDYSSLSYAHVDDPELGRTMDSALVQATFAKPSIMRELPRILPSTGWELAEVKSECVSEVGGQASYWVSFAQAYMPRVKQAGLVAEAKVDGWWEAQEKALARNEFFAAGNYYTYFAKKLDLVDRTSLSRL